MLISTLKNFLWFLFLYGLILFVLLLYKYAFALSDYVIPSIELIIRAYSYAFLPYFKSLCWTMGFAVVGHMAGIIMAFMISYFAMVYKHIGSVLKSVSFTVQSYPVVAIIPLLYIVMNNDIFAQLVVIVIFSYFPIFISLNGILGDYVAEVEHFYDINNYSIHQVIFNIRISENLKTVIEVLVGSSTLAFVGSIVAELLLGKSGIGFQINLAHANNDTDKILVALFLIGIFNLIYLSLLKIILSYFYKKITGKVMEVAS